MNDKVHLDHAHVRHLLTAMLRIRRFEEKCFELYQSEKIRGFMHLYDGEEAVSVGVIEALQPQDAIVATYREHGQALARGIGMNRADGRDVRQAGRLLPRPRRLDARVRPRDAVSMAATPSLVAACRSPSARRWATRCWAATRSPPASSAMARWTRVRSTKA